MRFLPEGQQEPIIKEVVDGVSLLSGRPPVDDPVSDPETEDDGFRFFDVPRRLLTGPYEENSILENLRKKNVPEDFVEPSSVIDVLDRLRRKENPRPSTEREISNEIDSLLDMPEDTQVPMNQGISDEENAQIDAAKEALKLQDLATYLKNKNPDLTREQLYSILRWSKRHSRNDETIEEIIKRYNSLKA